MRELLFSLGLTLAVEGGLALCAGVRGRALAAVFLANVLTNPAVGAAARLWRGFALPGFGAAVAALELLAVLVEWRVYAREGMPHPGRFSLAANALSFGLGLALRAIV